MLLLMGVSFTVLDIVVVTLHGDRDEMAVIIIFSS
jgi:hypothetical protein